jgi:uncharacterized protein (DUF58 family)
MKRWRVSTLDGWLTIAAVLVLIGLAASEGAIAALGFVVLHIVGLSRLWSQWSPRRLEAGRSLPENRAFLGEKLEVRHHVENRKALPIARLEFSDHIPVALPAKGRPATAGDLKVYPLKRVASVGAYQRLTWSEELACSQRGHHPLGPLTLKTSDLFGFYPQSHSEWTPGRIIVYPPVVSLEGLQLPGIRPFGETRGGERIFEDPLRVAGVRDYQPGDPLRRVDWKATARRQRLQSRILEPSSTRHLYVVVNIDTLEHSWEGYLPEHLERIVTAAASLALKAHDERFAVGLLANGAFPESDRAIRLPPGRSPDQLARVLEALAVVQPLTMLSIAQTLERESHRMPVGATLLAIGSRFPPEFLEGLGRLRRQGHQVAAYTVLEDLPEETGGLLFYSMARWLGPLHAEARAAASAQSLVPKAVASPWSRPA